MTGAAAATAPLPSFEEFFNALWGFEPFPWQAMLAEQVAKGGWPEVIDLPTAAGKTACMDVALYALAAQAELPPAERSAPRRIWFVVDRRIVVDAAFERAGKIAARLREADTEPLAAMAARLRSLSAGPEKRPALATARLRGGIWRDDGWARLPSQPAVICSTVDQVGSALLFRPYGHGANTAAIWAGLAANDSLILLDEAHCARPFGETLEAVRRFRQPPWCQQAPLTPFHAVVMSATHGAARGKDAKSIFPAPAERAAALDSEELRRRIGTAKRAKLHPPVRGDRDAFVSRLAEAAAEYLRAGHQRVAVMVNRVATAEAVAAKLQGDPKDPADVVLLTGRMRPLDRDDLVREWEPKLRAKEPKPLARPAVVVTTQCLEVGADFDFDALVTECASLDALRQRFGRLNRLGRAERCAAAVLIQEGDAKGQEPDPIYGEALAETWKWLGEIGRTAGEVDFGIGAMDGALARLREANEARTAKLYPPAEHAPVLLPAHLDMLCQTGPRPAVEPEPALFLHGPRAGPPEARVIWRAGLAAEGDNGAQEQWQDSLELVPPNALEALSVPIYRLRGWLEGREAPDRGGDVEGAKEPEGEGKAAPSRSRFGLWRWERESGATLKFSTDPEAIRPGGTVVLRAEDGGADGLGQLLPNGAGPGRLDLAERAVRAGSGRILLRVRPDVLAPWRDRPGIAALLAIAADEEATPDREDIQDALRTAAEGADDNGGALAPLPEWLREQLSDLAAGLRPVEPLPNGGLLLTAKKRRRPEAAEDDDEADTETGSSAGDRPVALRAHTAAVRRCAEAQAARCLLADVTAALVWAAKHHDLGKLDRRFQLLLNDGEPSEEEPLAKSARVLRRWRRRRAVAPEDALPAGFRHEMLSLVIAQAVETELAPEARELALHLVASHHGHARPFAPVVMDAAPEAAELEAALAEYFPRDSAAGGSAPVLDPLPAHHLGSGVADRFWLLTRRYGWWGLAHFETIFRLADWQASAEGGGAAEGSDSVSAPVVWAGPRERPARAEIELTAIDGANPLGFLAALGTLRLAERAHPELGLALRWRAGGGGYRPVLCGAADLSRGAVLKRLAKRPRFSEMFPAELLTAAEEAGPKNKKGEPGWKDKLRFPVADLRGHLRAVLAAGRDPDYVVGWAGECGAEEKDGVQLAARTRFDFTAGNQAFAAMVRGLDGAVGDDALERAVFTGWRLRPGVSMRWDPEDEKRQYALQASDPTDSGANPPRGDAGANLLACHALAFFPLCADREASQPGFTGGAGGRELRWPLWGSAAKADTLRSLLALRFDDANWAALGIMVVLRSRVVKPSGRYSCFTPAEVPSAAGAAHAQ